MTIYPVESKPMTPRDRFWALQRLRAKRFFDDNVEMLRPVGIATLVALPLFALFSVYDSHKRSESLIGYLLNPIAITLGVSEMWIVLLICFASIFAGALAYDWIEFRLDPDQYGERPGFGRSETYSRYSWTVRPAGVVAGLLTCALLLGTLRLALGLAWKVPGLGWRERRWSYLMSKLNVPEE